MRKIEFRGKTVDDNTWVYGYYVKCRGHHYILQEYNDDGYDERWEYRDWIEVIDGSLQQWTVERDEGGTNIFK